jgi:hypothetical protein
MHGREQPRHAPLGLIPVRHADASEDTGDSRLWDYQAMRSRLSYANVVSTLALFLALGGASYAALTLPRNSVGTPQLRNGSVMLSKLAFPVGMAAGTLGHTVSVGEPRPKCGVRTPEAPECSYPPPTPPRTVAVASLKLTKPAHVLILESLSVEQSPPANASTGEEDSVEVQGAGLPRPILDAADGYSATVTGERVTEEQPGTHHYYLKVGGYVIYPTRAAEAQIVAIALPGGEILSCPSARLCA